MNSEDGSQGARMQMVHGSRRPCHGREGRLAGRQGHSNITGGTLRGAWGKMNISFSSVTLRRSLTSKLEHLIGAHQPDTELASITEGVLDAVGGGGITSLVGRGNFRRREAEGRSPSMCDRRELVVCGGDESDLHYLAGRRCEAGGMTCWLSLITITMSLMCTTGGFLKL